MVRIWIVLLCGPIRKMKYIHSYRMVEKERIIFQRPWMENRLLKFTTDTTNNKLIYVCLNMTPQPTLRSPTFKQNNTWTRRTMLEYCKTIFPYSMQQEQRSSCTILFSSNLKLCGCLFVEWEETLQHIQMRNNYKPSWASNYRRHNWKADN